MYDTERIYDQAFTDCLNSVKQYRDQWNYLPENQIFSGIKIYTKIWNVDTQQFAFVQKQTEDHICKALIQIVRDLLTEYKYAVEFIDITRHLFNVFSNSSIGYSKPLKTSETNNLLSFIYTNDDGKRVLYIFKEFGIQFQIANDFVNSLRSIIHFDTYRQISWVDQNAYLEDLDHNDNENDPGRGTNTYSFDLFFEHFFGKDELARFHQKYDALKKEILDYCGIILLKTLRPNVVFSYRNVLRESLSSFDYDGAIAKFSLHELSIKQKHLIDSQFIGEQFMSALVSFSDFAKCFMTAEWLYSSLKDSAEAIDLTSISMGYFKALEQFMYAFIGLHTSEKDNKRREIPFLDGSTESWQHFTDDLYKQKKRKITLGNMAKFLKNRDNRDLLRAEIDDTTFEIIRDVLSRTSDQRNGYFHKDNIDNWSKIVDARDLVFILFYFFLGAYGFSSTDKNALGIDRLEKSDNYDELFAYINRRRHDHELQEIPILYLSEKADKCDFWVPCFDEGITYNEFGIPRYTGLYLCRIGEKKYSQVFTKDTMPNDIFEGNLIISSINNRISIQPTGPLKRIFRNGEFTLE